MLKALSSTIFALLLVIGLANAGISVYTIDGKFEAAFPSPPQVTGNFGTGGYQSRGFVSSDDDNIIVYTATYQMGRVEHSEPTIEDALNNYVTGQVQVVNGNLIQQRIGSLGGKPSIEYVITYNYSELAVKKHGAAIYHDGRFYNWSIQTVANMSKQDGYALFKEYVKYFRVK